MQTRSDKWMLFFDTHMPLMSTCSSWPFCRAQEEKKRVKGTGSGRSNVSDLSELTSLLPWNADFSSSAGKPEVEPSTSADQFNHSVSVGASLERS